MATTATSRRLAGRLDRYRSTERDLWRFYGLDPSERLIEIDSLRIRVRVVEVGSGAPVLFVPGSAGTGPVWAPLVAQLHGIRCLMVDRPGYGLTTPIDYSTVDYPTFTNALLNGVLDQYGVDRASVVGQSIGAAWALHLAAERPSRVDRAVLIGGTPLTDELPAPTFIKLLTSPIGHLLVRLPMRRGMIENQLRGLGHGQSIDTAAIPDEFFEWRTSFANDTDAMRHERNMAKAVMKPRGWATSLHSDQLTRIDRPVLMTFGTADPTGSPEMWTRFVSHIPDGELELIANAGHIPWLDEPQRLAETLTRFIIAS